MTASIIVLVVAMLIRVPIAFGLLGAAVVYYVTNPQPDTLVAQAMVSGIESFPMLAIPLFVLAGTAIARGGIAERLMTFADALVGHFKGGLGQVNVVNSLLMGGMSGSANADAATDAKILVPVMTAKGYSRDYASALSAASGIIAPMIPPGIGMIMYGLLAQVSIGKLFLAGLVPGILIAVALMLSVRYTAGRRGYGSQRATRLPFREVLRTGRAAAWALFMPVLLVGGLRAGAFTPTELGAIAAVYALLVGVVVYREIGVRQIIDVFREAVITSSIVMIIIAAASAFSAVATLERIPHSLGEALRSVSDDPWVVLLVVNAALLILGAILESGSLLIILTPILAPVAVGLGIDPVHFGVVIVLNLTIGTITPPIGTVLYTVSSITGTTVEGYTREISPLLVPILGVLLLVTFVPAISLALPNLMFGP